MGRKCTFPDIVRQRLKVSEDCVRAMPILTFPALSLMGLEVSKALQSAELQAEAICRVADRTPSAAAITFMDLSVEAEAFGARVKMSADEVPSVEEPLVKTRADIDDLIVPSVGAGRTKICLDAVRLSKKSLSKPLYGGCIGPFTLAGRLMGVSEIMMACFDDPDGVKRLLEKSTDFLEKYMLAYRNEGADAIMVAEPLAGLISSDMNMEFSLPYMKRLVSSLQTNDFSVIYHNCGPSVVDMADAIFSMGAAAYHFGNAIDIADMLKAASGKVIVMGNVDPCSQFVEADQDGIYTHTLELLERVADNDNFILSSGCDIPLNAKWENIDAFYRAAAKYYS